MKFDDKKKNILLLILGVLSIILLLVGTFVKNNKSDIIKFKEEYEEYNGKSVGEINYLDVNIPRDGKIEYIDEKDLLKALDSETAIFYFGFPTCPWCRNIVEPLLNVSKSENVKVYYFNPRSIRSDDNELYSKVVKKLNKYLEEDENGNKVLYVPDVYFIKNGEIIGHHLGSLDSQEDPYTKLSSKQVKELEKIFSSFIKKMK